MDDNEYRIVGEKRGKSDREKRNDAEGLATAMIVSLLLEKEDLEASTFFNIDKFGGPLCVLLNIPCKNPTCNTCRMVDWSMLRHPESVFFEVCAIWQDKRMEDIKSRMTVEDKVKVEFGVGLIQKFIDGDDKDE